MIRRRNKERDDSTIDITPMLDIVFIMLIFFIVTTSFVKETGVEVNRPNASTAVRDERGNILIAITANDEIWIDKRRVDLRSVRANVERLKAFASYLDLDMELFESCLDSGKFNKRVQFNTLEAKNQGVTGTPTFFIVNSEGEQQKLVGAQP